MPLYTFQHCEHHIEKLMLLREYVAGERPLCPTCQAPMDREWTSRRGSAQSFDVIVIDESPNGEFSFPMNSTAPVREGFVRKEIRTFAEADAVMRRVNGEERRKIERFVEAQCASLEDNERRNHGDLRSGFAHTFSWVDERGVKHEETRTLPSVNRMTPLGRAFAELAMRSASNRRPRSFDPNAYLEIREMDRSNRDPYEDRRTGWRERRS